MGWQRIFRHTNLGEVIDGVLAISHDPEITIQELMDIIPGPDFPTGGYDS